MTIGFRALGQLFWRPASILGAFPLVLALFWPFAMETRRRPDLLGPVDLATVLWVYSILFMGLLGTTLSTAARGAHGPMFAFSVPSLRRNLQSAVLAVGVSVAVLLAACLVYSGDVEHAVALLSCALLFFALGLAASDSVTSFSVGALILVFFVVGWFQPELIRDVYYSVPTPATIASIILAAAAVRQDLLIESARSRALFQMPPGGLTLATRFKRSLGDRLSQATWQGATSSRGLTHLLGATDYENYGAFEYGWLKSLSWVLLYNCGFAHLLGMAAFAAYFGYNRLSMSGHRLVGRLIYPIARKERARLNFVGSLLDSVGYFLPAMGAMWLLEMTGFPRFPFASSSPRDLVWNMALFPAAFAWAPVVQWLRVTSVAPQKELGKVSSWTIRYFVHWLGAISLMFATQSAVLVWLLPRSATLAGVAFLLVAIAVQLGYWRALRGHFRTKDLI